MKAEVSNILEYFKINILNSLSSQLHTLHTKKKQNEGELSIDLLHQVQKETSLKYFPLDKTEIYHICEQQHTTIYFLSLQELKFVYVHASTEGEQVYFISQKFSWKPHLLGMIPNPMHSYNPYWNNP